jgi:hypothetical protein
MSKYIKGTYLEMEEYHTVEKFTFQITKDGKTNWE